MATPDLYELLGCPRDAAPEQIRKAFRRAARKHHPDRNPGDPEAAERFRRVQLAGAVLQDPARRARYDATGEYDDAGPDRAESLVMTELAGALAHCLSQCFEHQLDPKTVDLADMVRRVVAKREADVAGFLKKLQDARVRLEGVSDRFSAAAGKDNLLGPAAAAHLGHLDAQIAGAERELATVRQALAAAKDHSFRADGPGPGGGRPGVQNGRLMTFRIQ